MADRRCWKCKQPFGPFERPMDFTYDGTTITRHDDCVPALMRGIEAAVEALRGLVEASLDFRAQCLRRYQLAPDMSGKECWPPSMRHEVTAIDEALRTAREVLDAS